MKADKSTALSRRVARFFRFRNAVRLYFISAAMHFRAALRTCSGAAEILSDVTEI